MHICIFLNAQLSKLLSLILFPCFMLILFSLETAAQTVQVPCPEKLCPRWGLKYRQCSEDQSCAQEFVLPPLIQNLPIQREMPESTKAADN